MAIFILIKKEFTQDNKLGEKITSFDKVEDKIHCHINLILNFREKRQNHKKDHTNTKILYELKKYHFHRRPIFIFTSLQHCLNTIIKIIEAQFHA